MKLDLHMLLLGLSVHVIGAASPILADPPIDAFHIVGPQRSLGPGERLEFRIAPPPPEGTRIQWSVPIDYRGIPVFHAPYVIAAGTPPAIVTAALAARGWRRELRTEVELLSGTMSGAEDCLGESQKVFPRFGDYVPTEQLPFVIEKAEPEIPASTRARSVSDTIPVHALLCRDGRVLDAFVPPSYRTVHDIVDRRLIERDPKLVAAALEAARRYLFHPAMIAGQPVAVWVALSVAFP